MKLTNPIQNIINSIPCIKAMRKATMKRSELSIKYVALNLPGKPEGIQKAKKCFK